MPQKILKIGFHEFITQLVRRTPENIAFFLHPGENTTEAESHAKLKEIQSQKVFGTIDPENPEVFNFCWEEAGTKKALSLTPSCGDLSSAASRKITATASMLFKRMEAPGFFDIESKPRRTWDGYPSKRGQHNDPHHFRNSKGRK